MRIGTGPSGTELTAQFNLLSALNQLNQSAQRLSTMQRINSGGDDPAGLIAAESLRAELTAINQASDNAARAAAVVRVADSALGQVSGLLNTIRGNLVAAANSGGLSDAELDALQLETDAALEAINRIGNVTSFGGRKLLDGSGGIDVSGVNSNQVADVEVYSNPGGEQSPVINVTQAAESASLTFTDADATLDADVELQLTGDEGTVVLQFSAGATLDQIAAAVNSSSDTTGVEATVDGNDLVLSSEAVGSDASVAVDVLEGIFDTGGQSVDYGTDVVATVDGVEFTGQGNQLEVNTAALKADLEFADGFTGQVDAFTISGEGLTFSFSPNATETSTLALPTVSTSTLGGAAGRLSDLASGGQFSLTSGNLARSLEVLNAATTDVLQGRARAGAFEKYTIESTQNVLGSMQVNLSEAFSQIFDADAAAETSNLIRAQILVQAGTSSLMIASQSRSAISSLFGGGQSGLFG